MRRRLASLVGASLASGAAYNGGNGSRRRPGLPPRPGEADADVRRLLLDDILRLNGKQTIYQMMQFAERVRERGSQPREPLWYKHEYLRRLNERIAGRLAGLRAGEPPDRYLVH